MTCPNCGSKEIITIQGENYCINCGQLVPKTTPQAPVAPVIVALPSDIKPQSQPDPKPSPQPTIAPEIKPPEAKPVKPPRAAKKRSVGRPKKPRLDQPIAAPITAHSFPAAPTTVAVISGPLAAQPARPRAIDALQAAPVPMTKTVQESSHRVRVWLIVSQALEALVHPLNYVQLIPAALAASLPVSLVIIHRLTNLSLLQRPLTPDIALAVLQILIALVVLGLMIMIAVSAITYGQARRVDGRSQPGQVWVDLAVIAFGRLTALAMWMVVQAAVVLAVMAGLVIYGSYALALPTWLQAGGVFIVGFLGWYYLAGIIVAWPLAASAIILGNINLRSSLKLAWRSYRHHFELFAAWIWIAVLQVVLVAALSGGWLYVHQTVPGIASLVAGWVAAIVGFMGVWILLAGGAEASYRSIVMLDHTPKLAALLIGRAPAKPQRQQQMLPVLLVLALGAIIVGLGYLPASNLPHIPGLIG